MWSKTIPTESPSSTRSGTSSPTWQPRETPAFLSYSPATGVTESSFYAFDTTSLAANIRPPPGLEHLMMDAGSRPSPLDSLDCLDPYDPWVLPMGPFGTEPPSFPPKFAAPHVDLEDTPDTPPAPPEEPCLRLALLQYLPENENVDDQNKSHDTSSCRPCAFYHTKGCQNGSQCIFCHICPPGEKKRRQKLRRKAGGSVGY
mmetsp:Transcript_62289/g.98546  ORF Transcript_62289/g.98546 Transcript_62289/m.98546 type:complete len:201 (+) Transcript_62289:37-639(+)